MMNKPKIMKMSSEKMLKESEEKFRSLIETTSDWIWEVDQHGVYTYASPKIKDLLGYESKEIIGKTPFDLMPPDEAKRVAAEFRAVIEAKKSFDRLENVNLHKDGQRIVLETSGVPIFDASGNLLGYRGIDRDITERKKMEDEQKRLLHDIGERVKEIQCLYEVSKLVENPDNLLDDILQKTVDLIPPSLQYPEVVCARIIFEGKEFKTSNFNETIWKLSTDIVISGEKKGVIEVFYLEEKSESTEELFLKEERYLVDALAREMGLIAERKKAEERIQQQNEFLNNVMESLTHPFYVIDVNDYSVEMANAATGWDNLSGKSTTCYALTHKRSKPCEDAEHFCPLKQIKKTKKPAIVEHTHYDKDGNARVFEVHGFPIFDNNGNVIQMIEYSLDITERKRTEKNLQETVRSLERFNKIAVGRELQMIELKREVNDLLRSTDRQEKYKIHTSENVKNKNGG